MRAFLARVFNAIFGPHFLRDFCAFFAYGFRVVLRTFSRAFFAPVFDDRFWRAFASFWRAFFASVYGAVWAGFSRDFGGRFLHVFDAFLSCLIGTRFVGFFECVFGARLWCVHIFTHTNSDADNTCADNHACFYTYGYGCTHAQTHTHKHNTLSTHPYM